jgi:hypothetical protein
LTLKGTRFITSGAALDQAQNEIDRGEGMPASEVIAEFRKRAR